MSKLTTSDKIGLIGLIVAVLAIVASLVVPEIRGGLGLEDTKQPEAVPSRTDSVPEKSPALRKQSAAKPVSSKEHPAPVVQTTQTGAPYRGIVVDSAQRPVAGVRIVCSSCETPHTTTDAEGIFLLHKKYPDDAGFRQASVSFSKGNKTTTLQLDWRDPGTITF